MISTVKLSVLPEYLIIHLDRFWEYPGGITEKLISPVKFSIKEPFEFGKIFSVKHWTYDTVLHSDDHESENMIIKTGGLRLKNVYRLYSMIMHKGSID